VPERYPSPLDMTADDAIRFGPYWLEARIAVGGTAEVYLARPVDPRAEPRRLVVKRLLPDLLADPEGRSMFEREAHLHASVRHPNVVEVFGSGETDEGEPYLAMEYVDGVDGYRLLRQVTQKNATISVRVAVHIVRQVLLALDSVHRARDDRGVALGIVHRDVTPSNVYLERTGLVKLGDFGIARASVRGPLRTAAASAMIKGKLAYLSPEQVAGEPFDGRADLFSAAALLVELVLGVPLFGGAGQLAILLAIRDCNLEVLHRHRASFPPGLYDVLHRALARAPEERFQSARAFEAAIAPFDPDPEAARKELAALVAEARRYDSTDRMLAVRDSARRMVAAAPKRESRGPGATPSERPTGEYTTLPSYAFTRDGRTLGPWTFARVVEALATGEVGRGDELDFQGQGRMRVEHIDELARFLPPDSRLSSPGAEGATLFQLEVFGPGTVLEALLRILEGSETGVLAAERGGAAQGGAGRKELYVLKGRLHHVASSNASELLGEYLVRRGKISREELDMALAVLPRNQGRMGDTLISLGLVDPVDLFQAIRDQGRDRVAELFTWREGRLGFQRDVRAPPVEFPLDLDLVHLVLLGLEAASPGDAPMERYRGRLGERVTPGPADRQGLARVRWPEPAGTLLSAAPGPRKLAELVAEVSQKTQQPAAAVLRALDLLLAARLVTLSP
jgi:serine/threonine protein kinase